MTDEWKESSRALLAKAWETAEAAQKVAKRNQDDAMASFAMQQAQFLALVAIYKSMDESMDEIIRGWAS